MDMIEEKPKRLEADEGDMSFEDSEEDDGTDVIGFPCDYNENMAPDQESVPAFVKINGAHADGGFRVIPADDQENREAEMFCVLWKDSGDIEFSENLKVWLGGTCHQVVKFST